MPYGASKSGKKDQCGRNRKQNNLKGTASSQKRPLLLETAVLPMVVSARYVALD